MTAGKQKTASRCRRCFLKAALSCWKTIPQGLQLALLDIQMPGLSGMETAHRLRGTLPELEIVFITSLTGYALESYEVAALDYLVKPVSYPRVLPQP